jgi:hypothetical protein
MKISLQVGWVYLLRLSYTCNTRPQHTATSPTHKIFFFLVLSLLHNKGGGVGWGRAAAAAKIRSSTCSSAPGKRDKYRYEVECVTDVPIGCILNR